MQIHLSNFMNIHMNCDRYSLCWWLTKTSTEMLTVEWSKCIYQFGVELKNRHEYSFKFGYRTCCSLDSLAVCGLFAVVLQIHLFLLFFNVKWRFQIFIRFKNHAQLCYSLTSFYNIGFVGLQLRHLCHTTSAVLPSIAWQGWQMQGRQGGSCRWEKYNFKNSLILATEEKND